MAAKNNDRSLTDDQRTKLFDIATKSRLLLPAPNSAQIEDRNNTAIGRHLTIYTLPGNDEALRYGQQIASLLASVGWHADVYPGIPVISVADHSLAIGLHYVINSHEPATTAFTSRSNEATRATLSCLSHAGIQGQSIELPKALQRKLSSFIAVGAQQ